jgi:ligand-binding sensor domain-containing protein/two-component sensor histidine kinase
MVGDKSRSTCASKVLIAISLFFWLSLEPSAYAQDQRIFQMIHTAWTARDGAPQSINNLAQTPDGTLWVAARDGLYSFDGFKFSVFQPVSGSLPRKNVQHLLVTNDGSLWTFGNSTTSPIRIREGEANVFNRVDQGAFRSLDSLRQSTDGTLWGILNAKELVRLGGDGVWHVVAGPKPECDSMNPLFVDSSDTLWLVVDDVLYRRFRGEVKFTSTGTPVYGARRFAEGQDHSIWIISDGPSKPVRPAGQLPVVGLMHVDRFGNRLPNPLTHEDVTNAVIAADGSVWLSHTQGGLQRLRPWEIKGKPPKGEADPPDIFDVSDGLTTTGFRQLLLDRDGDIWVAGGRGLDRFQRATMVPVVKNAIGGWWSVCASRGSNIWLTVVDGYRAIIKKDLLVRLKDREDISSILCEKNGEVHLLDGEGIAEIHNGHIEHLPLLPSHGRYWQSYRFSSVVFMPDKRIIASTLGPTEDRVWIYRYGAWKPFPSAVGIREIRAMMLDRDDNVYLGSQHGGITVLGAPGLDERSSEQLAIGAIEGFSETRYGILAFGENGVAVDQNGVFRMLQFSNPGLASSVTGLVEDRDGNIWINGSRAIARIASAEITAAISDPSHKIVAREFHEGDYKGSDIFSYSRNSAQIDTLGRLWFATANGVIYIDSRHFDRPTYPPILSIRSINADGQPLRGDHTFPPHTDTLDVRYFGLNLSDPADVVYRYKLLGSDKGWQDAGNRTEAIYTHIRPGRYVFQFEASNGDGIWTAPFDSIHFTILPAFYETWWFELLCGAAGIVMLWLGLTARVRYITVGIRQRAEERADERIRIARELHDTLLQGVQGLQLSFHAAASKVPAEHESKKALERALAVADRVILEGRNRVTRLRTENVTDTELKSLIEGVAADLNSVTAIDFTIERTGGSDTLQSHIVDEIFCISREALTNAFRHSEASRIAVKLDYQKGEFRMSCHDDGRGFDPKTFLTSQTNGHWGLRGMAERSERIGADFACTSTANQGTEIEVRVPARVAYAQSRMLGQLFKRRRAV